jgi:anti-sigma factor RsiW
MNCSPIELKDYMLNELADPERHRLEAHLKTCPACREELDRLRLTQAALFSLREEEVPQRIAFVSDPVFEPAPWRRWWTGFWASGARLGFASAAMLSAAILYSALTRPPAPAVSAKMAPAAAVQTSAALSQAEIDQRIQQAVNRAVDQAVSASQAQQTQKVKETMADLEQYRQQLKLASAQLDWSLRRADNVRYVSNNYGPPARPAGGEEK